MYKKQERNMSNTKTITQLIDELKKKKRRLYFRKRFIINLLDKVFLASGKIVK